MDSLPILISFFNEIDVLILIMVRVLAFLIFLPILSSLAIPMQFRVFLAFAISVAVFTAGIVPAVTFHDSPAGFIMLILTEVMTGALMGFMVFLILNVLMFAGQIMDFSMGFAMANAIDPIQQIQAPITGNVLFMGVSALLVATGGLQILLFVFFEGFVLVPIGAAFILGNADLMYFIQGSMFSFLLLAIRIALPIVGSMLIIDVCLGIMVKSVPQMNVFVVGMPLKVLVGLILMYAIMIPNLRFIYDMVFDFAVEHMMSSIEGMMPYEAVP